MVFSRFCPLEEDRYSYYGLSHETFDCLVYRIVEKATLVVLFSCLFVTTGSLLYFNEKTIMRRKIERVKDAMMSLSYSDKCVIFFFFSFVSKG